MISVQTLYNRVNDLSKKDQSGYASVDEFNRDLRNCENIAYEYYYQIFQETQKIADALEPFVVEEVLPISGGYVNYPGDYRHPAEMVYHKVVSAENCDKPEIEELPMDYLHANEERDTMVSYTRKPSLKTKQLYYTQVNKKLRVRPIDLIGNVMFKYFKTPTYGVYGIVLNLDEQVEVYDPSISQDLEWREQEETHILNLLLLHRGISIDDDPLVQFAILKTKVEPILPA